MEQFAYRVNLLYLRVPPPQLPLLQIPSTIVQKYLDRQCTFYWTCVNICHYSLNKYSITRIYMAFTLYSELRVISSWLKAYGKMCIGYLLILCYFIWGIWESADFGVCGIPRINSSWTEGWLIFMRSVHPETQCPRTFFLPGAHALAHFCPATLATLFPISNTSPAEEFCFCFSLYLENSPV